jgi:hypothetical protein
MPTPAQEAAARSSVNALSQNPLAQATVLKDESNKGFQELVRQPGEKETCQFEPKKARLPSAARWAGRRRALCAGAFIHAPPATHPGPRDFSP